MLDLCRLSSTVAYGVQVFLHKLFHIVEIMGDEGHGRGECKLRGNFFNGFSFYYQLYSYYKTVVLQYT